MKKLAIHFRSFTRLTLDFYLVIYCDRTDVVVVTSCSLVYDPVYYGAKWNGSRWDRSKVGTNGSCSYTRAVGTVKFGNAIRVLLAPLKEWFHLGTFSFVPV